MLVVDAHLSSRTLGLSFRKGKAGPEQELIDWFLEQQIIQVPRGHNVTVFREPRLPSGFPDLVIVIWKQSVARQWTSDRAGLSASDLRLMHFLAKEGPKALEDLRSIFSAAVEECLQRLAEAAMVRSAKGCWQARSLTTTFAASHIIAVEAKIGEWRAALDQAHLNTWFASESCVLVPRVPRNSELLRDARELGVRVFTRDGDNREIQAPIRSGPRSYVSWLFNDWAWRAAHSFGG
jgi:hypothetical protein